MKISEINLRSVSNTNPASNRRLKKVFSSRVILFSPLPLPSQKKSDIIRPEGEERGHPFFLRIIEPRGRSGGRSAAEKNDDVKTWCIKVNETEARTGE